MKRALMATAVLGALATTSAADRADDDLATVKKAVGTTVQAEATAGDESTEPAEAPAEAPAPARAEKPRGEDRHATKPAAGGYERASGDKSRSRKGEPQWIRVRIAEKGEKHARVSVNLPLALVRAFGEEMKLDDGHGHHTVGEVLRALDTGENLVDIEDEDATVHVWVE